MLLLRVLRKAFLILFLPLIMQGLFTQVYGQLQANFTMDKTGGCSPLSVSFTNTTTGASPAATYSWDLGNNNASTLVSPGAEYTDEKSYTVTLTVTDGAQTSTKSATVTVYKRPIVNFSGSPTTGCIPLTINFTSGSTAGDGTIANYFWDFGDGTTQQGAGLAGVSHVYTFSQNTSASLTVTNSYGCFNTFQLPGIQLLSPVKAAFTADKTTICSLSDAVNFTNNSTGSGTLSFAWDFGDGNTSALPNPSHVYATKGVYTVKMTVTNSGGCTDTQTLVVNAGTMVADFSVPALLCNQNIAQFQDQSSPTPDASSWQVDGVYNNSGAYLNYAFPTAGSHTVTLSDQFGGCSLSVTKNVVVKTSPVLNGFITDLPASCGAPITVQFQDTARTAVKWEWNFGDQGNTSALQAPSYTYASNGSYNVGLTVTDAQGCMAQTSQVVNVQPPAAAITLVSSSASGGSSACKAVKAVFAANSSSPINSYKWDFGDGGNSTDVQPTHLFSTPGTFVIHLTYTTASGCTGTAEYSSIHVFQQPLAAFSSSPENFVCGNNPVAFTNQSTGPITGTEWDFSGGIQSTQSGIQPTPPIHSSDYSPTIHFSDSGTYTVQLIVYNESCSDTLVKTDYIKVLPPFPKISNEVETCDGTRGLVKFVQASRLAQSWTWDFGDGITDALTTEADTVSHTYTKSGAYKVVLTTTAAQCTTKDSVTVYVLLKQYPTLSSLQTSICGSSTLTVQISHLDPTPNHITYSYDYNIIQFQYGDKSPFAGTSSTGYPYNWFNYNNGTASLVNLAPGEKDMRVIIASNQGCYDTSNYIPLTVTGPIVGFAVTSPASCFSSPVAFLDTSRATGTSPLVNWQWNFGDGSVFNSTTGGSLSHIYSEPGYFYPVLTITDAAGCSISTPSSSQPVQVDGPKASFTYSPAGPTPNTTIYFDNTTNTTGDYAIQYRWSFGDGNTSTDAYPGHSYAQIGVDTVKLIATDLTVGCSDTSIEVLHVRNMQLSFTADESYVNNNNCPPVVVSFSNTSINTTSVSWDFGDGSTADNQDHTSHVYSQPGVYLVTLHGYGNNGITDSVTDSVTIKGPYALLQTDALTGCPSQKVLLTARVRNASSFTWDFADGTLLQTNDTVATHQYLAAGTFIPSLILKDSNGCSGTSQLGQAIVIHPKPAISFLPARPVVCQGSLLELQASGGQSYKWSPPAGLSSTTTATTIASPTTTTQYQVEATNEYGCTNTDTVTVLVATPFSLTAPADTIDCLGSSVQLMVSGANHYNWISGEGLSDTAISDPTVRLSSNSSFTVVGYDAYGCFTDTATILVNVKPVPTVNIGPDIELATGSSVTLTPVTSPDVVSWNWMPADYLSCTNCESPVSEPRSAISYIAIVKNQFGCVASDTMSVKLICAEGKVYIANSFTPNNDGKNDVFFVEAKGIRVVRSLRIYDRWGAPVFESQNHAPNDRSAGWNGTFRTQAAPAGTYVYFAELECDTGEVFPVKGTVTLIR